MHTNQLVCFCFNMLSYNHMITREKIKQLGDLTADVQVKEDVASELLRTAQDRFGHETETFMREGQEITVTRKILWDEVFYLGTMSEAAKILMEKHPEVFEAYKAQEAAADALKQYTMLELGIDIGKMKLSDYLNLTVATFEMLMDEREAKK